MSTPASVIPTTLKWAKEVFSEDPRLAIVPGSATTDFKSAVQLVTGVPVDRQKLLSKYWKGLLKSDETFDLNLSVPAKQSTLPISLIGSAEKPATPPKEQTKFIEDVTPEEREAERLMQQKIDEDRAEGMIVALQRRPGKERDADSNRTAEPYQYSRIVHAVPQYQIETILRKRRTESGGKLGNAVMTLGMELRRAYVNNLATLSDGTLLSALDDGHIQMWRHAELDKDVQVLDGTCGGVEHIVAMPLSQEHQLNFSLVPGSVPVFATAGQGCVQLFNRDGQQLSAMQSPQGTSPCALVAARLGRDDNESWLVASACKVTYRPDPNQFRLVPQDDAERQRRAAAEEMERRRQQMLQAAAARVTVTIQNGYPFTIDPMSSGPPMPITALATMPSDDGTILVCGDALGALRLVRFSHSAIGVKEEYKRMHLGPTNEGMASSIVCMEHIGGPLLAVSTKPADIPQSPSYTMGSVLVEVPNAVLNAQFQHLVYVIDVETCTCKCVLKGHTDTVMAMKMLPDRSFATCGGKMDAKTKIWDKGQLDLEGGHPETRVLTEASSTLDEVGYVFSLAVLQDTKQGSDHYAIAAARYNVIKICI